MRHYTILEAMLTCIAFFCTPPAHSQDNRYYRIEPVAGHKIGVIPNSLYNRITLVDTRQDTALIGIIDPGRSDRPDLAQKFLFDGSPQPQLTALLNAYIDNTAKDGELLFQFRRFNFVERYDTRFCYLSAILYAKKGDRYGRLLQLDTTILLTGSVRLLNEYANETLSTFVRKALTLPADSAIYVYQDIVGLDSLARDRYALYSTPQYVDGQYNTSIAFLNQQPDWQGSILTGKKGEILAAYPFNSDGKPSKKPQHVYAIVYKGVPYIETAYGYYPMERVGREIFVTADIRMPVKNGERTVDYLAVGVILGSEIAKAGHKRRYRLIMDPVAGKFLHLYPIRTDADY